MLTLFTFEEWLGPNRECEDSDKIYPVTRTVSMVSHKPFAVALSILSKKVKAYRRQFPRMSWELRMLSSQEIPLIDSDLLSFFDVQVIEDLPEYQR